MATYTGVADANGDFIIPFLTSYTGGQKVTVKAEKGGAEKSIELNAPSEVVGGGILSFSGNGTSFPNNIGNATVSGINGAIPFYCFAALFGASHIFEKVKGLTIESGVTSLGDYAFQYWTGSLFVDIPDTVTSIGGYTFQNLNSCDTIFIRATTPPGIQSTSFQSLKSSCIFKVPSGSVDTYKAAPNWSAYSSRIQAI
jgi:hypothetical protein